jgi:hypothetical protein
MAGVEEARCLEACLDAPWRLNWRLSGVSCGGSDPVIGPGLRVRVGAVFSGIYLDVINSFVPKHRENNTKKHILSILIKPHQYMGLLNLNTRSD